MRIALMSYANAEAAKVLSFLDRTNFVLAPEWNHPLKVSDFASEVDAIWPVVQERFDAAMISWGELHEKMTGDNVIFRENPLDLLWRIVSFSGPQELPLDLDALAGAAQEIVAQTLDAVIISTGAANNPTSYLWRTCIDGIVVENCDEDDSEMFYHLDAEKGDGNLMSDINFVLNDTFRRRCQRFNS